MRRVWPLATVLATVTWAAVPTSAGEATGQGPAPTPEKAQEMETVVVSATRTETPVSQLGQSVTVITREQIENTRASSVTDLLRQVPGVDFRSTGPHSTSTNLGLRGLLGYHTKVLINGIPVQDSALTQQVPILNDINVEDIQQIEIVRGPSSTVYGSNALGGVVNIITRQGTEAARPTGALGVEFGSHGRVRTAGSVRGQSGPADYSFSLLRESEDGISAQDTAMNGDNDAWRNRQVQGTIGLRLAENVRLEYFGRYSSLDEEYDMGTPASDWGPATLDSGDLHSQRWMSGLRLAATDLFDGLLDTSLGASVADLTRGYRDDAGWSWKDRFSGRTNEYTWQNTLHLHERVDLTFGLDQVQESARVDDGGYPDFGIPASTSVDSRHRTTAAFAELKTEPIDNLFLNGGARWNNHSVFGYEWTWTAAAAYHIPRTGTRLKTSAGKAYRAPSLYELYYPGYGNPALEPETGTSWDVGFEQDVCSNRVTFGSTYFRNRVTDYIDWVPLADYPYGQYNQVNGIKTSGVENFVRYRPVDDLTLQLTHTYQHTNSMEADASPLPYKPRHKGSADLTWRPCGGPVTVNLNGSYCGHMNTAAGGGDHLEAYTLANAAVSYRVTRQLEVYARVQNLLNENYEIFPDYNEYGRVYYVGMNVSF